MREVQCSTNQFKPADHFILLNRSVAAAAAAVDVCARATLYWMFSMLYFCGFKVAFFRESSAHVSHMAFIILCSILTKCRRSSEKKTCNERATISLVCFFVFVFISFCQVATHLTLIVDIYVEYVEKKKWKRLKCSPFLWSNGKVNFGTIYCARRWLFCFINGIP